MEGSKLGPVPDRHVNRACRPEAGRVINLHGFDTILIDDVSPGLIRFLIATWWAKTG